MLLMNHATKEQLEQALITLGWERNEWDLWRQKKSGITVSLLDAVIMELQISIQERKPFQGRYFKEPREVTAKPEETMIGIATLTSYFDLALRKLKSLLAYIQSIEF
ncbi:MAG TPA: hypothetical protein VF784_17535 [Anaerolineales bacterium]